MLHMDPSITIVTSRHFFGDFPYVQDVIEEYNKLFPLFIKHKSVAILEIHLGWV